MPSRLPLSNLDAVEDLRPEMSDNTPLVRTLACVHWKALTYVRSTGRVGACANPRHLLHSVRPLHRCMGCSLGWGARQGTYYREQHACLLPFLTTGHGSNDTGRLVSRPSLDRQFEEGPSLFRLMFRVVACQSVLNISFHSSSSIAEKSGFGCAIEMFRDS